MSDKNSGKTVLVGMTGRMDSTIAAYLLKKQGLNCIGIAISFFDDADEIKKNVFKHWDLGDLEEIHTICNQLGMPFYAVNAAPNFKAEILDFILERRINGETFSIRPYVYKTIIEILISKMPALKADFIATGHFAKIFKNHKTNTVGVMVTNDKESDQSFGLSLIGQEELKKMLLPLSEMRLTEVEKVMSLINIKVRENNRNNLSYLRDNDELTSLVNTDVAKSLFRKGLIANYQTGTSYGEHDGIHNFFIGQNNIELKDTIRIDKKMEVVKIDPSKGEVYLSGEDDFFYYRYCLLKDVYLEDSYDESKPFDGYIQFGLTNDSCPCSIYLKNNKYFFIEFKEDQFGKLPLGNLAVVYDKEKNGKVIGSGTVYKSGFFERGEFLSHPSILENESEVKIKVMPYWFLSDRLSF